MWILLILVWLNILSFWAFHIHAQELDRFVPKQYTTEEENFIANEIYGDFMNWMIACHRRQGEVTYEITPRYGPSITCLQLFGAPGHLEDRVIRKRKKK